MANRQIHQLTGRTLALTDVIPTQDAAGAVEVGKNTIQNVIDLVPQTLFYKEIAGVLSQTGTSIPTLLVINSTLSGPITFARTSAGIYTGTLTNEFTNKTFIVSMNQQIPVANRTVFMSQNDASTISILVRKISDNTFVDLGQSGAISFYIKIYA